MNFKKCLGTLMVAVLLPALALASTPREIDAKADAAMARFHKEVNVADQLLAKATAVLVIPEVIKGGFIFAGEYGEGALRVEGKSAVYYSVASASFGLTVGGEMKDLIILFFSKESLDSFRARDGWEAGVDGNIAVWKEGQGSDAMVAQNEGPMIAFVVGVKGVLVDVSLKGSKFTVIKR